LLGAGVVPGADLRDDLNRNPSTTVDLRFRPVEVVGAGGMSHGFIVVADNATGKKWISEGGPGGQSIRGTMPASPLTASTVGSDAEAQPAGRRTASFVTDVPADEVAKRLTAFSSTFSAKRIPYDLPIDPPVDPYGIVPPVHLPVRNSNYYAGAAWEHFTGTVPELPRDITAPGWGDHRFKFGYPYE